MALPLESQTRRNIRPLILFGISLFIVYWTLYFLLPLRQQLPAIHRRKLHFPYRLALSEVLQRQQRTKAIAHRRMPISSTYVFSYLQRHCNLCWPHGQLPSLRWPKRMRKAQPLGSHNLTFCCQEFWIDTAGEEINGLDRRGDRNRAARALGGFPVGGGVCGGWRLLRVAFSGRAREGQSVAFRIRSAANMSGKEGGGNWEEGALSGSLHPPFPPFPVLLSRYPHLPTSPISSISLSLPPRPPARPPTRPPPVFRPQRRSVRKCEDGQQKYSAGNNDSAPRILIFLSCFVSEWQEFSRWSSMWPRDALRERDYCTCWLFFPVTQPGIFVLAGEKTLHVWLPD